MSNMVLDFDTPEYREILLKCVLGNVHAIRNMTFYFNKLIVGETEPVKRRFYEHLKLCWMEALLLYDDVTSENVCRYVNERRGFVLDRNTYFK